MIAGDFERVVVERGGRSGCTMAVAVHSTALGPALGGARMWHYKRDEDAVADAKRLASAMTLKAAAAGLDLGGGKGVIAAPAGPPPSGEARRDILLDFGDLVESLGGSYVTAEDVGTGAADMAVIAERTDHVVGLESGSGDPSPVTARGVLAAIRACASRLFGSRELAGVELCVIGLGHVGSELARLARDEDAVLAVSDIDPSRRAFAEELGARWVEPGEAVREPCDVLAPCALGGLIDPAASAALRAQVVCGAANNVLADDSVADALTARGVLYAPDFIANAGGLISVYGDLRDLPHSRALDLADGIERALGDVLDAAESSGTTPLQAAHRVALQRLRGQVPVG